MPLRRDRDAFGTRAATYEQGRLGELHHTIVDRTVELTTSVNRSPRRVLDIGCGSGYLLRELAARCPDAAELVGIDPVPAMIEIAHSTAGDSRLAFSVGEVEHLPFPEGVFDLVVSTTSFDHWADQRAGLAEAARVLRPGGCLVLVDQFSLWMTPTLVLARRGKARTRQRANRLLEGAGFESIAWHKIYAAIINAATAMAPR